MGHGSRQTRMVARRRTDRVRAFWRRRYPGQPDLRHETRRLEHPPPDDVSDRVPIRRIGSLMVAGWLETRVLELWLRYRSRRIHRGRAHLALSELSHGRIWCEADVVTGRKNNRVRIVSPVANLVGSSDGRVQDGAVRRRS